MQKRAGGCFVTDREEVESIEFQTKEDDDGSHVESGEIEEMDGDEEMKEENEKEKNGSPMEEMGTNKAAKETKKKRKKARKAKMAREKKRTRKVRRAKRRRHGEVTTTD